MTTIRDRALGRLAVVLHVTADITDSVNAAVAHFVETDEDPTGKERRALLEQAEYGAHMIATAVGDALVALGDMGAELLQEDEGFGAEDEDQDDDSQD
jgi:hypothetical protein